MKKAKRTLERAELHVYSLVFHSWPGIVYSGYMCFGLLEN